jgi:hypothetical protein
MCVSSDERKQTSDLRLLCGLAAAPSYVTREGGSYDWTWLLGSNGQALALAASDSDGADRRLAAWLDAGIPEGAFGASRGAPSDERCNG